MTSRQQMFCFIGDQSDDDLYVSAIKIVSIYSTVSDELSQIYHHSSFYFLNDAVVLYKLIIHNCVCSANLWDKFIGLHT